MESAADIEGKHAARTGLAAPVHDQVDGGQIAGDDHLSRCIDVGHGEIASWNLGADSRGEVFNGIRVQAQHGGHAARLIECRGRHVSAAIPYQRNRLADRGAAGGHDGRHQANAMASKGNDGHGIAVGRYRSAGDAKHLVEGREGGDGRSDNGRLLNVGRLEVFRTGRIGQFAERGAIAGIGRLPNVAGGRRQFTQVAAHPRCLGTLARKDKRGPGLFRRHGGWYRISRLAVLDGLFGRLDDQIAAVVPAQGTHLVTDHQPMTGRTAPEVRPSRARRVAAGARTRSGEPTFW